MGFEVNENQHCNAIYTMKIEKQQDKLAQMDQLIRTVNSTPDLLLKSVQTQLSTLLS